MDISVIREASYLVSRGVRHLAILDLLSATTAEEAQVLESELLKQEVPGSHVFSHRTSKGYVFGYGSGKWSIDLFKWVIENPEVPEDHRHQIVGMLLGYSGDAICSYIERRCLMRQLTQVSDTLSP